MPSTPTRRCPDQVWRGAAPAHGHGRPGHRCPEAQRQAVELAYFGGLTHAEIAAMQGAPLSTVKTRLALGLRKLADFLGGKGMSRADCLG